MFQHSESLFLMSQVYYLVGKENQDKHTCSQCLVFTTITSHFIVNAGKGTTSCKVIVIRAYLLLQLHHTLWSMLCDGKDTTMYTAANSLWRCDWGRSQRWCSSLVQWEAGGSSDTHTSLTSPVATPLGITPVMQLRKVHAQSVTTGCTLRDYKLRVRTNYKLGDYILRGYTHLHTHGYSRGQCFELHYEKLYA